MDKVNRPYLMCLSSPVESSKETKEYVWKQQVAEWPVVSHLFACRLNLSFVSSWIFHAEFRDNNSPEIRLLRLLNRRVDASDASNSAAVRYLLAAGNSDADTDATQPFRTRDATQTYRTR